MAKKAKAATNGYGKPGHNRGNIRPDMDEICCIIAKEGLTVGQAAMLSGAGNQTITNWQKKKTKRPQHLTMKATLAGIGYSFTIRQVEKIDYETEMPKAERGHEKRESDRSKMRVNDLAPGRCFFGEGTKTPSRGPIPVRSETT